MTTAERDILRDLGRIASSDIELAKLAASLSWFTDGIISDERDILRDLGRIASNDIEMARMAASLPWFAEGPQPDLHTYVLRSLARITELGAGVLGQLTAQPWFADGLNEAETAFVITLPSIALKRPDLYDDLLSVRYTQHKTISLPLAGDVNIWVIENAPRQPEEHLLSIIEVTARIAEGFLGLPFPTTDIILLTVPSPRDGLSAGGLHYGTHIVMDRDVVSYLRHEVAHYYFGGPSGPRWLHEGAAEFVESYINDHTGVQNLSDRRTDLSMIAQANCIWIGTENIRHHAYLMKHVYQFRYDNDCEYYLGHHFLLNLFETMGGEAMSSALRELHLLGEDNSQSEGRANTEDEIYYVFLQHTPSERVEEFRDLYRRLHGATAAFPETNFSDDHGDEVETASAIEVGGVRRRNAGLHVRL